MSELKPRRRLSSNHPNHPKPMKKPLVNYPSNSVQRPLFDPITFPPSFTDLSNSTPSSPATSSKPGTMEEGMKSLISVYNRLQDLQTNVGRSAFQGINLNLPQIVVVGTQVSSKSSSKFNITYCVKNHNYITVMKSASSLILSSNLLFISIFALMINF